MGIVQSNGSHVTAVRSLLEMQDTLDILVKLVSFIIISTKNPRGSLPLQIRTGVLGHGDNFSQKLGKVR